MKTPQRRPSRYDVTTAPREGGSRLPPDKPPGRPLSAVLRAALERAFRPLSFVLGCGWLWVRKPITLLVLVIAGSTLALRVIAIRSRPPTVDGPALPMAGWRATGYPVGSSPGAAIDGNLQTRWTTQGNQNASNWFAVDMERPRKFHQIVMDAGTYVNDYPCGYAVYVSGDGIHWGSAAARGEGKGPVTIVNLEPSSARYIKVVQTGQDRNNPWSICEFTVH